MSEFHDFWVVRREDLPLIAAVVARTSIGERYEGYGQVFDQDGPWVAVGVLGGEDIPNLVSVALHEEYNDDDGRGGEWLFVDGVQVAHVHYADGGSPIGDLDDDEIARCAAIIGVDPELVKQHGLIRATGLDPECSWVPAGRERDDYDGSVRSGVEISTSMADALMKSGWLAGRDG